MQEKNLNKQIKERLLAPKDDLVKDTGLIRVITIKQKYFDQIPTFHYTDMATDKVRSIPDGLEIIGQWNEHVIARTVQGKVIKCQIWDYAAKCIPRDDDYGKDQQEISRKIRQLQDDLPQIFGD